MSNIKAIQCPACGSNSTTKVTDFDYSCNYCASNFIVQSYAKKEIPFSKFNIETNRTNNQVNALSAKWIVGIILFLTVLIFGLVGLSISTTTTHNTPEYEAIWQTPSSHCYKAFTGSKGSVVWFVTSHYGIRIDSIKYQLQIINPKTLLVIKQLPFYKTISKKESFNIDKKINNTFYQYGDVAYNISDDNGFVGYNIYTFDVIVTYKTLEKQFTELNKGIAKVENQSYKNAFKITTNTADEFMYYPYLNKLVTKEDDDNAYKTDKMQATQLYLDDGKQPALYLINSEIHTSRNDLAFSESTISAIASGDSWYKKTYGINSIKKINETVYYSALPMLRYQNNMILIYTKDVSKKAPIILESIDIDGKTKWQLSDTVLMSIRKQSFTDRIYLDFHTEKNELILNTSNGYNTSTSVDLNTGKLNWVLYPQTLLK